MVERQRGHIINISSDAGKIGFPGLAVYSGTKFFVEGYSNALRKEISQYNIRVTCIQPGDVRTPLQKLSLADTEVNDLWGIASRHWTLLIQAAKEYATLTDESVILESKDIAKTIVFVVNTPSYVGLNEVLIEPVSMPI